MMGRLLIGIGQLYHIAVVVRPAQEGDASGQVVTGISRGDDDRWNEDDEGVDRTVGDDQADQDERRKDRRNPVLLHSVQRRSITISSQDIPISWQQPAWRVRFHPDRNGDGVNS